MAEDKRYVYFARPIDFAEFTPNHIRTQGGIEEALAGAGYSVYHPAYAWKVNGPLTPDLARCIESTNRFALRRATAVVAWLPEGVQTQGTLMEIEFATRHLGIPCIVIGKTGVSLDANPLVHKLDESHVLHLGVELDRLVAEYAGRRDPTIRYSAPTTLAHAHAGDAGVDLEASETVWIEAGRQAFVPSGVRVQIPPGLFGWVVARSSTFQHHGLLVLPGVIDEQYQGELGISCVNLTPNPVQINAGDRLGQLLLLANMWPGFHLDRVDEENVFPTASSRGSGGFGSTGK